MNSWFTKIKNGASSWYQNGRIHRIITIVAMIVVGINAYWLMEAIYSFMAFSDINDVLARHLGDSPKIALIKRDLWADQPGRGLLFFMCCLLIATVALWLVKLVASFNYTGTVTLEKGLRFGEAMERLGLPTEKEQLQFVANRRIPLYITSKPMEKAEESGIEAREHVYAHNLLFSKGFIHNQSGRRQVCFKSDDIEQAYKQLVDSLGLESEPVHDEPLEEPDPDTIKGLRQKVAELEEGNRALSNQTVTYSTELKELREDNKKLANTAKGVALREGKKKQAEQELCLYSIIFAPAYVKLARNQHDPRDFTRAALADFFFKELSKNETLHSQLQVVTSFKVINSIPANVEDAIWNNLKQFNLVNSGGAAPSDAIDRLTHLLYPDLAK